jgi:hypothetical protein
MPQESISEAVKRFERNHLIRSLCICGAVLLCAVSVLAIVFKG